MIKLYSNPSSHLPYVAATQRLKLRYWQETDIQPFIAMNCDPQVMKYFPQPLNDAESLHFLQRIQTGFAQNGFGLWAVELLSTQDFIGFVGLSVPRFAFHFQPCVEIGWRLAQPFWHQGYATEAAKAVLQLGRQTFQLQEIVSFTSQINRRSIRVMEKLNMQFDHRFLHPAIPEDHPLAPHVLYKISW